MHRILCSIRNSTAHREIASSRARVLSRKREKVLTGGDPPSGRIPFAINQDGNKVLINHIKAVWTVKLALEILV